VKPGTSCHLDSLLLAGEPLQARRFERCIGPRSTASESRLLHSGSTAESVGKRSISVDPEATRSVA
jgi:hypothetical protein